MITPTFSVHRVRPAGEELSRMAAEVSAALRSHPPSLPSKYFYDDRGSRLFDEITRLPEYYQTRTETALLARVAPAIVRAAGARELVELGSGASPKIKILLDALTAAGGDACTLLDVHAASLEQSLVGLQALYPRLSLRGVAGDFVTDLHVLGRARRRLVALLGGTIGNLHPEEATRFLRDTASVLERGGAVLLGVDLVKDVGRLERAYNDAQGVTAAFNRNILNVVNENLEGDFVPEAFAHVAFYDREQAWIEMRLRALRPQRVHVRAIDVSLDLREGAEIRTEISCKYTRESLTRLLPDELELSEWHTDAEQLFGLALLRRR
jgi:L-histidine N-alpha-methyltransferase